MPFVCLLLVALVVRFGTAPSASADGVRSLPLQQAEWEVPGAGCVDHPLSVLACVLADGTNSSYTSTRIVCTVAPSVGAGFKVRCPFRACSPWCIVGVGAVAPM